MYLLINRVLSGPFADAQVKRRYRRGELDGRIMSWCEGEGGWTSLARRWPVPHATARRRAIRGVVSVLVLAATGLAIKLPDGWFMSWLPVSLQRGDLLWLLVFACAGVAAGGLYILARSFGGHGIRIFPAVLAVYVACGMAFAMGSAEIDSQVLRMRHRAPNAVVSFNKEAHVLHITGSLGALLPSQVSAMLKRHPQVRGVVLDSPGGLVAPAFAVAQVLKARGLPATVDGTCASACVAIWAAAPRRRMTATSRIGLHQLRIGIDIPGDMVRMAKRAPSRRYDRILASAGFDKALIAKQKHTSPDDIYWVHAPDLLAAGVTLDIIGAHGRPVSARVAKWRVMEHAMGHDNVVTGLMQAVRRHETQLVSELADTMYAAFRAKQSDTLKQVARLLGLHAKHLALRGASDAHVVAWATVLHRMLASGYARGDVHTCAIALGSETPGTSAKVKHARQDLVHNVITLINTLDEHPHMAPHATRRTHMDVRNAVAAAGRHMIKTGAPTRAGGWNTLQLCGFAARTNGNLLDLPLHRAAQAIRYNQGAIEDLP